MHCGFPNMSSVFPANRATCAYSRSPLAQFSASLSLPSLLRHPHSNPTEMANQCWSRRHTNRRSRGVGGRFVHIQSLYGKRREAALETRWLCLARPGSVCLSGGCLRVASMLITRTNRDEGGGMAAYTARTKEGKEPNTGESPVPLHIVSHRDLLQTALTPDSVP